MTRVREGSGSGLGGRAAGGRQAQEGRQQHACGGVPPGRRGRSNLAPPSRPPPRPLSRPLPPRRLTPNFKVRAEVQFLDRVSFPLTLKVYIVGQAEKDTILEWVPEDFLDPDMPPVRGCGG